MPNSFSEAEKCFRETMKAPLGEAEKIGDADIVIGIPFYNEADTINSVIETARRGLEEFYPEQRYVIVAVGSPAGGEALDAINSIPQSNEIRKIAFLLDDERINGKGWSVRAIMEIAQNLGADLAILEADLRARTNNGTIEGLATDWVNLLLERLNLFRRVAYDDRTLPVRPRNLLHSDKAVVHHEVPGSLGEDARHDDLIDAVALHQVVLDESRREPPGVPRALR